MLESAYKRVRRGLEDRRNGILHVKTGAFPCHMLVREGALFLEGLGEVLWGGGEHKERKWEGKKEDLQVQSEITGTSVGYSKRLSRAEG